jgi:hypothetical protein
VEVEEEEGGAKAAEKERKAKEDPKPASCELWTI